MRREIGRRGRLDAGCGAMAVVLRREGGINVRLRLALDTSVLVSALLWQGTPGRPIELAAEKGVAIFTSQALLDELAATLAKKKPAKPEPRGCAPFPNSS